MVGISEGLYYCHERNHLGWDHFHVLFIVWLICRCVVAMYEDVTDVGMMNGQASVFHFLKDKKRSIQRRCVRQAWRSRLHVFSVSYKNFIIGRCFVFDGAGCFNSHLR